MSERTSTISEMRDIISIGAVSLALKRKYTGVRNTSKNFCNPDVAILPLNVGNTTDHDGDDPKGHRAFMRALQTLQWPRGFKIIGVEPYKGW